MRRKYGKNNRRIRRKKGRIGAIEFYWRKKKNNRKMCSHADDFCYGGCEEFQNEVIRD